jgi:NarL family two-component system response regulator LiaR
MRGDPPIRVVVTDDHHLVRQGIRALLERAEDVEVVGEAADGQQAVELVARLEPDVLVMDIAMPRLDGSQAVLHIRTLDVATEVVILSMYIDQTIVRQALRDGAKGYVPKSASREELLLAVRAAHRGEIYISPVVAQPVVAGFLTGQEEDESCSVADRLTPREREILQLVTEGHTSRSIAHTLQISAKTVEKHRASLMTKLDAHCLADLMRVAIRHGLVLLPP